MDPYPTKWFSESNLSPAHVNAHKVLDKGHIYRISFSAKLS